MRGPLNAQRSCNEAALKVEISYTAWLIADTGQKIQGVVPLPPDVMEGVFMNITH